MPDPLILFKFAISQAHDAGTVFIFNAYHIGKERCYFRAAQTCKFSVWVSRRRYKTLKRLQLPSAWMDLLTSDKRKADIIVSDQGVRPEQLQSLHHELGCPVIGFQCTGVTLPASFRDFWCLLFLPNIFLVMLLICFCSLLQMC